MRYLSPILMGFIALLPACQQARQFGSGLSVGSNFVSQPIISGSKKVAGATVTGTRKIAGATATGSRKVAAATIASGQKLARATVSGAKSLAHGATRLVTFGSAHRASAPSPLAAASPKTEEPSLPPLHPFPTRGLIVTDSELGPDATRLQTTAVNLAGGWALNGSNVAYRLEPGADDPTALRVQGSPATAILHNDGIPTTASAREIHYHAANQVLTLRGQAVLASVGTSVTATASTTLIKIHLPSGAISIDGPARWGQ